MGDSRRLHGTALHIFQGLAGSYDRIVDYATLYQDRHWKNWVAKRAGVKEGGLVLDLGCGTLLLEERFRCLGWRFVGLDLTEEMVRIGWAKGLPNVRLLINGDAESLPFLDQTFDAVVGCYVPKYVDTARLADELARVSKPGAAVVLYDFARPRGIFAPFLGLYIDGGLRVAGYLLKLGKRRSAFTFDALPGIIDRTDWDREITGAMERRGFATVEARTLTGGAVFGYLGRKRSRA
jgi:demethylmenaquinone methyltransferase / 2-methoxy-6-polyprenyl-1,4-benzoquinol methylase